MYYHADFDLFVQITRRAEFQKGKAESYRKKLMPLAELQDRAVEILHTLSAIPTEDALTERDYVGIMTLADRYTEELSLTPRTRRDKIMTTIAEMEESAIKGTIVSGGTMFSPALERAGKALAARSDIEKKHIVIVTDGAPSLNDTEQYLYWAEENAKLGITMSVVGIGSTENDRARMIELLQHAGRTEKDFYNISKGNFESLPTLMRENLEVPEIKSVNYEPFVPTINVYNSITHEIDSKDMPTLEGYYGVKLKENASAVLMGKYTPIYSQWDFGKGRVGTFACDLNGTWSEDMITSDTGKTLINNIIYALFPTEDVRDHGIEAAITGENYTTNLSIFTELGEGEYIQVTVTSPSNIQQVFTGNQETGFSRMTFATKESGMHTIVVQKLDAAGNELAFTTIYKSLSYSKEYNAFADRDAAQQLLDALSVNPDGQKITDPLQVYETAVEFVHVVIDPRVAFSIAIICCFLLDIAVRKFKWKWPHELIEDRKRKLAISK